MQVILLVKEKLQSLWLMFFRQQIWMNDATCIAAIRNIRSGIVIYSFAGRFKSVYITN